MDLYILDNSINNLYEGMHAFLKEDEAFHCIKVMRKKINDKIWVTDGKGNMYESVITEENPKKCGVLLLGIVKNENEKSFKLHMAVAPTKNIARYEWFLEKATEIGIDEITPLLCEHSERINLRTDRLEKIIIAACKQSFKPTFPKINEAVKFNDLLKNNTCENKFLAYVEEAQPLHLKNVYTPASDCIILIGPEGDFSKNEIELAQHKGYKLVSLGSSRLRTETAAIVACHTINLINEK